jgi:serine/threonine-protein kinase
MWHLFGQKKRESSGAVDIKPDLDLLNGNCYECDFCSSVHSLEGQPPLAMGKCPNCNSPNFIPYLIKNYWLYKPLGGGGMGSVYKAIYYNNPKWEFAIKVLPRDKKNDPHLIESLMLEAKIGKSFGKHPHLIAVADYGKYRDEYFVALEFCEGKRLDQVIDLPEPVNQKYVLLWALQLLSAEQKIWDAGYLYRDIKPQNIMIDPEKNVRLYDYGLCIDKTKSCEPDSDVVQGSPLYMPPERIVGVEENMSSEIYSIGMVMYHALARKTYYTASGAFELAKKHVTSLRTNKVSAKLPTFISPRIADILDKMLPRIPKNRYQSFKEAAIDIKRAYNKL